MWIFIVLIPWLYSRQSGNISVTWQMRVFWGSKSRIMECINLRFYQHSLMVRKLLFMIGYNEKLKLCRRKQIVWTVPSLRLIYSPTSDHQRCLEISFTSRTVRTRVKIDLWRKRLYIREVWVIGGGEPPCKTPELSYIWRLTGTHNWHWLLERNLTRLLWSLLLRLRHSSMMS